MPRRLLVAIAACFVFALAGPPRSADRPADRDAPSLRAPMAEADLLALERENGCVDEGGGAPEAWPPGWNSAQIVGGDVPPTRVVQDAYPTLHSVVVDPERNRVFMSDPGRHALWSYERTAASKSDADVVRPLTGLRGPATGMMFVAAVTVDPQAQEIYTVDNDIGDRMMVFPYDANGNVKPKRVLEVPHQAWGLSINEVRGEIAATIEAPREIVIYKKDAHDADPPLRIIRGSNTGLGDPHGVFFDGRNNELVVANHGNHGGRTPPPGDAPASRRNGTSRDTPIAGGRFDEPSINVYAGDAKGNVAPIRKIQGPRTGLNWPMAIDVDLARNEIAVANNGDSSIRIFRRTDSGDVAPVRVIKGALTGIAGPMGVAFDRKNSELWVANYGDHAALVFASTDAGDVAPKRVVRNGPKGSATVGFGNPGAVAYDSKRDEILVPN